MSHYKSWCYPRFKLSLRNVREDFGLDLEGPFGKQIHKAINFIEKDPHPDENIKIHNDIHGEIAYILEWDDKLFLLIYEINESAKTIAFIHLRHFKEFEAYYEVKVKEI